MAIDKLDTVEAVSHELDRSPVRMNEKRCSFIRNKNVSCRRCLDVCPSGALTRQVGRLFVDTETCLSCGACALACPTTAFLTVEPNLTTLVNQARESAKLNRGTACFMCEKSAEEYQIDRSRVVVVPCANYLDEYIILGLFLVGIERVAVMRPSCEGCERKHMPFAFEDIASSIKQMQKDWNFSVTMLDTKRVPENLIGRTLGTPLGTDRRAAFAQARDAVVGMTGRQLENVITGAPMVEEVPEEIIVALDDLFGVETYRSALVLKVLGHLGKPEPGATTTSRFWGQLSVDLPTCIGCGHCATFCPTKALRYIKSDRKVEHSQRQKNINVMRISLDGATDESYNQPASLLFEPAKCIQCKMCIDTCRKGALHQEPVVKIDDLLRSRTQILYKDKVTEPPRPYGRFGHF